MTNSNISRQICTTRAQREAEAEATREWQRSGDELGSAVITETIQ